MFLESEEFGPSEITSKDWQFRKGKAKRPSANTGLIGLQRQHKNPTTSTMQNADEKTSPLPGSSPLSISSHLPALKVKFSLALEAIHKLKERNGKNL